MGETSQRERARQPRDVGRFFIERAIAGDADSLAPAIDQPNILG